MAANKLISKETLAKLKLRLILLSYLGCFTYGLVSSGRGSIYPDLLKAFRLNDTGGAIFFSLASATGLIANLMTSKWYPRLGPIKATSIFLALLAAGTFLVSASPRYEIVLIGAGLIGFALGGSGLLFNVMAAHSTRDSVLRRQVLAGLHAAFGIASMIAPLLVNALAKSGFDWRMTFAGLGLAPLAVMVLSLKTDDSGTTTEWKSAFVEHKPWRRTLWFAAICTLYVAVETLISTRLTLYAERDLGFTMSHANVLLSAFFLTFTLGRIAFTVIRTTRSNAQILFVSGFSGLGFFLLGLSLHPIGFVLCGLGFSVFYPCMMAYLADDLGPATEFAMSWCQILQGAGAVVMHVLVGWLSDQFGLHRALLFGPLCLVVMLVLLVSGKDGAPW